jgi:hypothetical protein
VPISSEGIGWKVWIEMKPSPASRYVKWVPSSEYDEPAKQLLSLMRSDGRHLYSLRIPFILTLAAGLEARLNDAFIAHSYICHGPRSYRAIVDGYLNTQFKAKIRLAVSVLTNNQLQVRESSPLTKQLDELIAIRNRFTHPRAYFYQERGIGTKRSRHEGSSHPILCLSLADCERFHRAVAAFDKQFLAQHERGRIEPCSMLTFIG